ncbi:exopolyphosphatase domain protein [Mycobacterium xenopi 4042]|uniref:Exopolyphosphatase domain protein n=1 Tax=Mycobacterium xenopi 4042 TaxID=1299334 RepID=X8AJN3_MYCXE|nr:exopolyphosphatase domain protein [Mycobacterium xenopi 4042]
MDVLSDDALIAARSRLNPAAGMMLSALWAPTRPAGAGHSPPGRRRGVMADPAGGPQHRLVQHRSGQPTTLPATGRRMRGGRRC